MIDAISLSILTLIAAWLGYQFGRVVERSQPPCREITRDEIPGLHIFDPEQRI